MPKPNFFVKIKLKLFFDCDCEVRKATKPKIEKVLVYYY